MTGSAQLAAPSLYSPNNASNDCYTRAVFQWYRVNNATGYLLQIDTVSTFNSGALMTDTLHNSGSQSLYSYTHYNLRFKTRYYWRMCATNATDTSAWSEVRWLRTMTKVTLNSPDNNANCYTRLFFTWYNSRGCTSYILQLDTTPSFNSPLLRTSVTSSSATNENTNISSNYENDLLFSTNYYWRVRAINAADTSSWSDVRQFHTHARPVQSNPDSNATLTNRDVQLRCYSSYGCIDYEFQLDTAADFGSPLSQTYTATTTQNETDTYVQKSVTVRYGYTYHWRVRCYNNADTSDWSLIRTFTTPRMSTAPQLSTPANGATGQGYAILILSWNTLSGITGYHYEVSTDSTFEMLFASGNTDSTFATLTDLAPYQTYYWRVRGYNNDGNTIYSDMWSFSTHYCQDSYSTIEIAACDSYTWKDTTYTQSGTYTFDTLNTAGCDSTVTLNLTISYSAEESFADTATAEYHWNDSTYYESGDYIQTLATEAGCDSTVTLHLIILPDVGIRQSETAPYTLRASADRIIVEGLGDETVRLYDLQGRCLQSLRATGSCTLRIPNQGVYLVHIGTRKAEKIVAVR